MIRSTQVPNKPVTRRLQTNGLKRAAQGHWVEILVDAGAKRVTLDGQGHPCPMCEEGTDRFAAFLDVNDRGAVHCRKCFTSDTDPRPGDGIATLQWLLKCSFVEACAWLATWLAEKGIDVADSDSRSFARSISIPHKINGRWGEFESLAKKCHRCFGESVRADLAARLQLPIEHLVRLRVGYSSQHHATTWPMRNETGQVIGIRLRSIATDRKWSVDGSDAGVFVPVGLPEHPDRLFVAEGPTDTAALLSLGLDAIGRPSANGASDMICGTVAKLKPRECVVVADRDEVGQRSAQSLCDQLIRQCRQVRMITPPMGSKDARAWITAGANLSALNNLVDAAAVKRLTLTQGARS